MPNRQIETTVQFVVRWWWAIVATLLGFGLLVAVVCCFFHRVPDQQEVKQITDRVLVVTVPGTYGNQGFWPNVIPDKATFASELLGALGPGSEIYPFLWASSVYHDKRVEAARNLAELIDRRAKDFDRVYLVGHSHGGNVALLAAALCQSHVDGIVCLSTPHVHIRTVDASGENRLLPVYCSVRTVENTGRIVTISPNADHVPDTWSNETLTGLSENEAIALTTEWRETLNHPRLPEDRFLFRLFESGNIVAVKGLQLGFNEKTGKGAQNCLVHSFVKGLVKPHGSIHSRRMGRVVGELIGSGVCPETIDYLRRLIQPADEDNGEPVALGEYRRSVAQREPSYAHAGWLLQQIRIELDKSSQWVARDEAPDPYLCITSADGAISLETKPQRNVLSAQWNPDYFFPNGVALDFTIWNSRIMSKDTPLGVRRICLDRKPPEFFPADLGAKVYWSGSFDWISVHY